VTSTGVYLNNASNGFLWNTANGGIQFGTNNTERMRIDSSGRLGLGIVPSATTAFTVFQNKYLSLYGYDAGQSHIVTNTYYPVDNGVYKRQVSGYAQKLTMVNGSYIFNTAANGAADSDITFSAAMTIDSSGNVLVGITSAISSAKQTIYEASLNYGLFIRKGNGTTGATNKYIGFDISGGGAGGGSITNASTNNAQFTATSDERLKENITDINSCLDKIMALKPSSYTWKVNQVNVPYGFIAQNVETVLPEFVTEDEEGYKQISDGLTSGYIAVLTKAVQEQQTLIETLEARLSALEE
jgi:hypothetical protein